MDLQRIEQVTSAVLRREYLVRVAILRKETTGTSFLARIFNHEVPLFGAEHDDKEIIGFGKRHIHVDWRFASTTAYAQGWKDGWYNTKRGREKALVVEAADVIRIEERPMVLRRHATEYPNRPDSWQPRLEAAFADKKLTVGMVCPHRGAKLSSCKQESGCVRCPMHGLNWDVATGQLVRLFEPVEA